MNKDQSLPNKNIHRKIVLENHFQLIQIILEVNQLIIQTTEDNHQTKEIHVISHKIDIVDQIVEITSMETSIQDRIQADRSFRVKPVPIHTLGIDTFPMIDQENLRTIEIKIIPKIGIETIQMIEIKDFKTIDHVIFLTTDKIIKDQM